jgi:hypothetical protein
MRSCLYGAECEPKGKERQLMQINITFRREYIFYNTKKCGLDFAYAYFCSFVFFSTFLVKWRDFELKWSTFFGNNNFANKKDVEPFRCSHHG